MSYDARVFNVMIAFPNDVKSERTIVREVIYEWNAVHSAKENIVLLPVGWESHSSPEMGRPQEIINRQAVDKCDLLVGIFGTRLGTDTGEYDSGTIEEIERGHALGKPVMIYYSKKLEDPDTFDSDQYTKLNEWKKKNESRWLYETYNDDADFKDKFYRQLEIKVNEHEIFRFRVEGIDSGLGIDESESNIPQLSDEAKVLLKEASQDRYGYISYHVTSDEIVIRLGGDGIINEDGTINDKNLIPDQNPRVVAQWKAALKELTTMDLLENADRGNTSLQIRRLQTIEFLITHRGYRVADMIEVTT